MRVSSLHIYPVKGVRAVDLARARVERLGLAGDRRWLVVDAAGVGITQRTHPGLATIIAELSGGGIVLSAAGAARVAVAAPDGARRLDILIWGEPVNAALADDAAHRWLSERLGDELRLVCMDTQSARVKTGAWTGEPTPTSFADAFPLLVATTGSLAALNEEIARKGGAPVPMARFRPNVVIDCDDPWAEDFWKVLRIGDVEIELVKPCDRCVVTTRDQQTGESAGKEPLASLARLRRSADPRINGVLFGWNAVPLGLGDIAIGDAVRIIGRRERRGAVIEPSGC